MTKLDNAKIVGIVGIALLICGTLLLVVAASTTLIPDANELGLHDKNLDGIINWHDADVNNDTRIDLKDLGIVGRAVGNDTVNNSDGANWNPKLDLNEDNFINEHDLGIVQFYIGSGIPLSFFGITIPEVFSNPTTQMFIAIVMIICAITLMYIGFIKK